MKESKTNAGKSVRVIKKLRSVSEMPMDEIKEARRSPYGFIAKLILVAILGTVIFLLVQKYRGLFLAGTVNSMPVTRHELNQKMAEKYGKQTFDEIISERILSQEIKKNNIVISDEEVAAEMAKIVADYGSDEAFKAALSQYGLTEEKAKESVKQSLSLRKLIEKNYKIEITDEAVKKYFDDNKKLFEGKKFDDVKADIKETLFQQEVYTKTQEWFTEVKKNSKVVSFI